MSDTISFRYSGDKEDWLSYKHQLEKHGTTIQEKLSTIINQEVMLARKENEDDSKTASRHQDELTDKLLQNDLSFVLRNGKYHINIDNFEFIKGVKHELKERINNAVHNAVYKYWITKWAVLRGKPAHQAGVYYCENKDAQKFMKTIRNRVNVTFNVNLPLTSLSDLKEDQLGHIIQFNCVVIGVSPQKLDSQTGRYIQKVLLQEPENEAKHNNPRVIKGIVHGDDTMDMASGQTKKILGIYKTQEPINGQKVEVEKTLIIDVIAVKDAEEKEPVILTPHELDVAREMAQKEPEKYINMIIDSFCPKIFGRRLEKLALLLSLVGGSEFVNYRKETHLMLVGESDTGKTELLKFGNEVAEKSSLIDGSNATGVGLLFSLDEYDGVKILRSGQMIINNGGHLFIAEYDKMRPQYQKELNTAQEQQRALYNKGGHKGNAETKTTVIVDCNPVNERWNEDRDIVDNLPFGASTVSRFDIIIRTKHETQENQIREKMRHITKQKRGDVDQVLDIRYLKGLLNHLRKLRPTLSPKAEELLIDKFVQFTQIDQPEGALPIQTRQMEGIQRLCEAYAKLLHRKEIDENIVNKVLDFYKECLETLGMKTDKGISQIDLRGGKINKDEYFEEVFRNMALENDDGDVVEYELGVKLLENNKFFKTDKSVSAYIENRKKTGWIYEPRVGVLRKQ